MVNRMKDKGDRAEREAVELFRLEVPHLLVANPMRQLGAGRKDDIGDLHVLPDVAIQVKACSPSTFVAACRAAAISATVQAQRALAPIALGMVKVPGARGTAVRWLACVQVWPVAGIEPVSFGAAPAKAAAYAKDTANTSDLPRVAAVSGRGAEPYLIAPMDHWLDAYIGLRASQDHANGDRERVATP